MEKLRQARWAQLPRGRRMGLLPKQDYDARVANAGTGGCARLPIPPANCFSENARNARTGRSLAGMDFPVLNQNFRGRMDGLAPTACLKRLDEEYP